MIVSLVGAVGVGLSFLSEAQSSDLDTSMGATGLLTVSMLVMTAGAVLWSIVLVQRCSRLCGELLRRR